MAEHQNTTPAVIQRRWIRGADGHWRRIWVVPSDKTPTPAPNTPEPDKDAA